MATEQKHEKVLIIGTGADNLQHAEEIDTLIFEVATTLKNQGFQTILLSNNAFSYSLDSRSAIDIACIKAVNEKNLVQAIRRYQPTYLVPTLGGRHAFEIVQEVAESGIFQRTSLQVVGVPLSTIRQINNPLLLNRTLHSVDAPTKAIATTDNYQDAAEMADKVGLPVIIRSIMPAGTGFRQIVHERQSLNKAVMRGIQHSRSGQIMVQQSLAGLKEIGFLVLRDASGTMMSLGVIEDADPIGTHAGDSVAVMPAQTLTDRELQDMRDTAFAITRKLRIVGLNHIQFALDQDREQFYIIKNSPYLDRMTTFATKATGYPISRIIGDLYSGQSLRDIHLDHGYFKHAALTEPVMDHVALRAPIWPYELFKGNNCRLTTEKKSISAVIGIGRSLPEAISKVDVAFEKLGRDDLRLLKQKQLSDEDLETALIHPRIGRIFLLIEALRRGYSVSELSEITHIDQYYFTELKKLLHIDGELAKDPGSTPVLEEAKYLGISDQMIARFWSEAPSKITAMRHAHQMNRTYKEVEPSAGEFECHTSSFYSTFEQENETQASPAPVVMLVGLGPINVGQSTAGEYFTASVLNYFKQEGFHTVVLNNNPSSLSLSTFLADKRYIEPVTEEMINSVLAVEQPDYLILPATEKPEQLKLKLSEKTKVLSLPAETQIKQFSNVEPLYNDNLVFDGQHAYSLGIIGDFQSPATLSYQGTGEFYPANLSARNQTIMHRLGQQEIGKLKKPGIYQLIFSKSDDDLIQLQAVQLLPLTEMVSLSKVLGINLPDINLRLLLNQFDGQKFAQQLASHQDAMHAVYRTSFPFHALHIDNGEESVRTIIGAKMEIDRDPNLG
ncbi:carbamoyl phosphate synthase large subunit [Limosilactobacillus sp.]|uniref:ATP-binding protein n=1 Tax=Limosilactobacillus sp. TaxID=2773925 RepID=UPI00345E539E